MKLPHRTLGLLFVLSTANSLAFTHEWKDIYQRAKASIPFILSSGGICSGALISPKLILTAKHCVESLRPVWISWADAPANKQKARTLYIHPKLDFALVELESEADAKRIPLEVLSESEIREGSLASTIGHPTSGALTKDPPFDLERTHVFSSGHISKFLGDEIIVDFSISPGNSGGPVLDEKGRVIGVVSRKLIQQFVGDIGYAVSAIPIQQVLLIYKTAGALPTPKITDIPPSLSIALLTNWDGFQSEIHADRSSYRTSFQLELQMLDRIGVFYANTFGLNKIKSHSYGVSYKFESEFSNTVPFRMSPFVEATRYAPQKLANEPIYHSWSAGLLLGVSGVGMNLKLAHVSAYEKSYWGLALVFGTN